MLLRDGVHKRSATDTPSSPVSRPWWLRGRFAGLCQGMFYLRGTLMLKVSAPHLELSKQLRYWWHISWWQHQGSVLAPFGALRTARSVGWVKWSPGH